jgi:integrase
MASVSKYGGTYRVQFFTPDGKRQTLYLGGVDKRTAQRVAQHVATLLAASRVGAEAPADTLAWLKQAPDALREKLVRLGLLKGVVSPMLGEWCRRYIDSRTDLAKRTVELLQAATCLLTAYFGERKRITDITPGDAMEFAIWLQGKYAENTARRMVGYASQIFRAALAKELVRRNPFQGIPSNVRPNRTRDYFVTQEMMEQVLEACPSAEWRAFLALMRYGGLRPGEALELKWGHVLWDQDKLTVPQPKTAKRTGKPFRVVPLFPELRRELEGLFAVTAEGTEWVLSGLQRLSRWGACGRLKFAVYQAGLTPWPKLCANLRSSRATELVQEYPAYVVTAWLGHTPAIAEAHYWQVTEEHFRRATQSATQTLPDGEGKWGNE